MNLNTFQQLQGLKANKSVKTENFYVENGILACDNYFVPLDAVSSVSIIKKAEVPIFRGVICIVFGVLLLLASMALLKVIGLFMTLLGILNVFIAVMANQRKEFYLTVRLNNGEVYSYTSKHEAFLQDVMSVMQHCINDRRGVYNINMVQQNIEYKDDHSVGKTTIGNIQAGENAKIANIGNGRNVVNSTIENSALGDNSTVRIKNGLTENEWKTLERFFAQKVENSNPQGKITKYMFRLSKL